MAGFQWITNRQWMRRQMDEIVQEASEALNQITFEIGYQLAEFILCCHREGVAGLDYASKRDGE